MPAHATFCKELLGNSFSAHRSPGAYRPGMEGVQASSRCGDLLWEDSGRLRFAACKRQSASICLGVTRLSASTDEVRMAANSAVSVVFIPITTEQWMRGVPRPIVARRRGRSNFLQNAARRQVPRTSVCVWRRPIGSRRWELPGETARRPGPLAAKAAQIQESGLPKTPSCTRKEKCCEIRDSLDSPGPRHDRFQPVGGRHGGNFRRQGWAGRVYRIALMK